MPQERPVFDDEAVYRLPRIVPITSPMPIPAVAWDAEPKRCLEINAEWASYVLGMMDALDQPDAWQGTDEEIFDARQNVRNIILALAGGEPCTVPITDIRVNGCLLQLQYDDSGEWTTVGDISACATPGPQGPAGPPGADGAPGAPGAPGVDAARDASKWRDNSCQLQLDVAGVWTNITGASYMRKQADCPFTGRVEITPPSTEGGILVTLPTGDTQPGYQHTLAGVIRSTITADGVFQSSAPGFFGGFSALQAGFSMTQGTQQSVNFHENVGGEATHNVGFTGRPYSHRFHKDYAKFYNKTYLQMSSSTGTLRDMSSEVASYDNNTDATREVSVRHNVHNYAGGHEVMRLSSQGTGARIGFFGAAGQGKPTISGDCLGNEPLKGLLTELADYGLITDTTTLGEIPMPEPVEPGLTLEQFRCRVAAGAMQLMIYEYYNQAITSFEFFTLCDSVNGSGVIRDMIPFFRTDEGAFYNWNLALCEDVLNNGFDASAHIAYVKAFAADIKQAYYCALDENGLLDPLGYNVFVNSLTDILGSQNGGHFQRFIENFTVPAMAEVNATGYHFFTDEPCEFTACEEFEEWHTAWNFGTNSGSTEWTISGGHYTSFSGWVQDNPSTTMVMSIDNHINRAVIRADANAGDGVTITLFDLATNGFLAQEIGVAGAELVELVWDAVGDEGESGIEIRLQSTDNDFDSTTNARLVYACLRGDGAMPGSGDPLQTCF